MIDGAVKLSARPKTNFIIVIGPPEILNPLVVESNVSGHESSPTHPRERVEQAMQESAAILDLHAATIGYLGTFISLAAVQPYYGLFLKKNGFHANEVGMLFSLAPVANVLFLFPLSGWIEEHRGLKLSVVCGAMCAAVPFVSVMLLSSPSQVVVGVLMSAHFLALTPVPPFLDKYTLSMVPPPRKTDWMHVRGLGAYGWGIGAIVSAAVYDTLGWRFITIPFALGVMATLYCFIRGERSTDVSLARMEFKKTLSFIGEHPRLVLHWVMLCLMGMAYVVITTFLYGYLEDLGAPHLLFGLSAAITVLTQIPLFRCATWIHDHFSDQQMIAVAQAVWCVRVVLYSFLSNPWLVILLEPLHIFTFGFSWLAGMSLANRQFPPELVETANAVFGATMFGIGPVLGNNIGGIVCRLYGPEFMFRVAALFVACSCVVYFLADYLIVDEFPRSTEAKSARDAEMHPMNSQPTRSDCVAVEEQRKYVYEEEVEELVE